MEEQLKLHEFWIVKIDNDYIQSSGTGDKALVFALNIAVGMEIMQTLIWIWDAWSGVAGLRSL